MDSGEARILQLGYKQELARNFGLLSNASIGFTAISILTGITGAFFATHNTSWQASFLSFHVQKLHSHLLSVLDESSMVLAAFKTIMCPSSIRLGF